MQHPFIPCHPLANATFVYEHATKHDKTQKKTEFGTDALWMKQLSVNRHSTRTESRFRQHASNASLNKNTKLCKNASDAVNAALN